MLTYVNSTIGTREAGNQLVEAGILIERTGYHRNRVFVAEAVLAIVNRPFCAILEV